MGEDDSHSRNGRLAWNKVAPPRAQLLVWFVLQGKLNTRDRLFRFGVPGIADDLCVFCKEERKTINHIMFGSKYASSVWYFCCNQWNLAFSLPEDPILCFLTWMDAPFYKFDKKIWTSLFYVITWSIWWIRNKVVFQNFEPNWEVERKLTLWRLGSWIKGWCPNFPFLPGEMYDELVKARRWSGRYQRTISTYQLIQRWTSSRLFCLLVSAGIVLVLDSGAAYSLLAGGRAVNSGIRGYPIRKFWILDPEKPKITYLIPDPKI